MFNFLKSRKNKIKLIVSETKYVKVIVEKH